VRSSRTGTSTPARRIGPLSSASPSRPLPSAERAWFESRLGADFSQVRVHTGGEAAMVAGALGAKAFAAGNDIAFGDGRYQPDTSSGRELLAHELAHVTQQQRSGGAAGHVEPRARSAAETVAHGGYVAPEVLGGAEPGLHCDPDDDKKNRKPEVPPLLQPGPQLQLQTLPPIDFLKQQSNFSAHAERLELRDVDDMAAAWQRNEALLKLLHLEQGINLGFKKFTRDDLLNIGLSLQVNDRLQRESPNIQDKFNKDWSNAGGGPTIILPLFERKF
jgi:hypothetical protein